MRSHFRMSSGTAMACAVAGAATILNNHCAAQSFAAFDQATDPVYAGGWAEGQNGGHGFGPWSFFGTDPSPGALQTMSTASALGRSWTLFNTASDGGLANAGRAIPGGLQVGQTFETFIVNPSNTMFYRGWEVTFINNTNNDLGGSKLGEQVSLYHFEYFNYGQWQISDLLGNHNTSLKASDTNPGGVKIDLTLTSTNTYHLVMTPLSNPGNAFTTDGNLKGNGPINWVQYQMFNTATTGTNDVANNFEISSMSIQGTLLNIMQLSWTTNTPGFVLAASSALGPNAVWSTNLPAPVVANGSNYVTVTNNGSQQFYRLALRQ